MDSDFRISIYKISISWKRRKEKEKKARQRMKKVTSIKKLYINVTKQGRIKKGRVRSTKLKGNFYVYCIKFSVLWPFQIGVF